MKGFFGIGVENGDKPGNLGNLWRTAQGFGASFVFTVAGDYYRRRGPNADTSQAVANIPLFQYPTLAEMKLPQGCHLVGVELTNDAVDLPSFYHPPQAAYVLGPERGELSQEMLALCSSVVKIPTAFCLNQATAGAVVMYDRIRVLGRWPARPVSVLGDPVPLKEQKFGGVLRRKDKKARRALQEKSS